MTPRPRHIPIRTCAACRTAGDKRGLLRVVRLPDGAVQFDPGGKASGRGAYVCASATCIETARKRKSLDRSLNAAIDPSIFEQLLQLVRPADQSTESVT